MNIRYCTISTQLTRSPYIPFCELLVQITGCGNAPKSVRSGMCVVIAMYARLKISHLLSAWHSGGGPLRTYLETSSVSLLFDPTARCKRCYHMIELNPLAIVRDQLRSCCHTSHR